MASSRCWPAWQWRATSLGNGHWNPTWSSPARDRDILIWVLGFGWIEFLIFLPLWCTWRKTWFSPVYFMFGCLAVLLLARAQVCLGQYVQSSIREKGAWLIIDSTVVTWLKLFTVWETVCTGGLIKLLVGIKSKSNCETLWPFVEHTEIPATQWLHSPWRKHIQTILCGYAKNLRVVMLCYDAIEVWRQQLAALSSPCPAAQRPSAEYGMIPFRNPQQFQNWKGLTGMLFQRSIQTKSSPRTLSTPALKSFQCVSQVTVWSVLWCVILLYCAMSHGDYIVMVTFANCRNSCQASVRTARVHNIQWFSRIQYI